MKRFFSLIFCVVLTTSAQILASFLTFKGLNQWYATLEKPFWSPPDWVFAPVWTLLYLMMAFSLYFLMRCPEKNHKKIKAYVLWGTQLVLNVLWCSLFFYFRFIGGAVVEILFLIAVIALYILETYPKSKAASLFMIPYFFWVVYAATLNFGFYVLN